MHQQEEGREGGRLMSATLRAALQGREQVPSAERAHALAPQGEELLQLQERMSM